MTSAAHVPDGCCCSNMRFTCDRLWAGLVTMRSSTMQADVSGLHGKLELRLDVTCVSTETSQPPYGHVSTIFSGLKTASCASLLVNAAMHLCTIRVSQL